VAAKILSLPREIFSSLKPSERAKKVPKIDWPINIASLRKLRKRKIKKIAELLPTGAVAMLLGLKYVY